MADISKIVLPDGNEYNIKDATARQASDGLNARLTGDIEIPANSDLDNYKTLGEYYCWGNGSSVSNKPPISISSFRLRVEVYGRHYYNGGAYYHDLLKQTLYPVYDLDTDEYYVRKEGVLPTTTPLFSWNDWIKYSNSDENYTTTEKNKLAGIAAGAEANVQSDWNETDTTADSYIQNKPNPYLLETFIPITDGDDLDDYTTPGEYYASSSSVSVLHSPVSDKAFRLRVENFPTATFIKQTFSTRVDNASVNPLIYVRFYNANTQIWDSWRGDGLYARLIGDIAIPANSDLNTYVIPGEYKCHLSATAQTITNAPTSSSAFRLRVEYGTHEDSRYIRQVFTPYNHRFPYIRVSTDSGSTWNDWVREGTGSNIGMVKLSDTYSSAVSGANVNGYTAATQNALYNVYSYATGKASSSSPNLKFRVGTNSDTADDNPHVELRESGTLGTTRRLSLIYYDANGTTSSISLVNENGDFLPAFPPKSHASTATTYGQGNASNYGHVKLSDTYSSSVSGANAAGGVAASQNALYNAYANRAPKSHASSATTYGQGNASNYGHVKLSDTYTSSVSGGNAAGGVAASQNALYNAYAAVLEMFYNAQWRLYPNCVKHIRSNNGDTWAIFNNADNIVFMFNPEYGYIHSGNAAGDYYRPIVYGKNDTLTLTGFIADGFLTSAQKEIDVCVPCIVSPIVSSASVVSMGLIVRHNAGGYAYLCYGSSNNQYVQLGTSAVTVWSSSATAYTNGVTEIVVQIRNGYLRFQIRFANTLRTNAGTNVVTNNTPIAVQVDASIKFT